MHYSFATQTFTDGVPKGCGMSSVIADTPEEATMLVARRRAEFAIRWPGSKLETSEISEAYWCECCAPKDQPNARSRQEMSADISPQAE